MNNEYLFFWGIMAGIFGTLLVAWVSNATDVYKRDGKRKLAEAIDARIKYHSDTYRILSWGNFHEFSKGVRDRLDKLDPPRRRATDKKADECWDICCKPPKKAAKR